MTPRVSTPAAEGQFQAAKWLKVPALLTGEELAALIAALPPFWIVPLTPVSSSAPAWKTEEYVSAYTRLIEALQNGSVPPEAALRPLRAVVWTSSPESLWLQPIAGERFLVKPCEPLLQVELHQMAYSPVDGQFRSMILTPDSFLWGLQFSFPGVYQEPHTQELKEVKEGPHLERFQLLRRWIRHHTVATPMIVGGKRVNLPVRIGKQCFSWVNRHPQLRAHGLSVLELAHVS